MKKLFTLFTVLLLCTASSWAQVYYYIPVRRVTSFDPNKSYMLYNTAINGNEDRTGFIYVNDGNTMKKYVGTRRNPKQFMTTNTAYLWRVTTGSGNHVALQNESNKKYYGMRQGDNDNNPNNLYLYQWETLSTKQSDANSQNEDDPTQKTANANITFDNNKVFVIGGASNGTIFWNGTVDGNVTYTDGHPFAFYEVETIDLSGYNVYTGASTTLNESGWKTQSNWSLTNTWNSNGPGITGSGMWNPIYLNGVTASGISFEGWKLRLKLENSTLTANTKKLQSYDGDNVTIDIDQASKLHLTLKTPTEEGGGNDPGTHTFNIDGCMTIKTESGHFAGISTNTVNLGTTGSFTFEADDSQTIASDASFTINAKLTEPTELNTVQSRTLATFTNVTVSSLTVNVSGTDGWTLVDSREDLNTQTSNGKYYYVEKNNSSGVTLYTFHETRYVTSDATLSDIPDYQTYGGFIVNSGVTLTVDVADFDLTKITGEGNIVLAASTSLTGNKSTAATGKLTVNSGVTLTIGGGDTQTNSVASFTSIDLKGTINNNNSTTTLKNVTVPSDATGIIYSYDMGSAADGFLLAGTTAVNGTLYVCNKGNFQMKVDQLTGGGTWTIYGKDSGEAYAEGTSSQQEAVINVASATSFTGSATVRNTNATVNVAGNLAASTWTKSEGTLYYTGTNLAVTTLDGTTLDGAILASAGRINTSGVVSIKNLAGNNNTAGSHNYALVGGANSTINLFGTCDFTKKSDGTTANTFNYIGSPSSANIVIKAGATVTTNKVFNSGTDNATVTIEEGATLITPEVYSVGISVTGDATLATTTDALNISAPVTVASGKTLTIDGGDRHATVTFAQTPTLGEDSRTNFVNTTFDLNSDARDLSAYTFTNSTATFRFIETGAEYATGNFTVTNVPDGITIRVKKYDYKSTDDTEYYTATKTGTTATLSHEVGVSGSAAWLDYTFKEGNNPTGDDRSIQNKGNAGTSDQALTLDTDYKGSNSFNADGTLKVKSTPWRDMTWPTDYTVAVSANFPDVENGCLMAFGSSTRGSQNYLALIRGASSNEIKLVNGTGSGTHYTEIATMSAENATASPHLVVFTKQDKVFKVYLDGVKVTQTTYSDALGTGFQVGSLHGGVRAANVAVGGGTGLLRVNDTGVPNEAVYAKAVRVYDYVISDAQMEKLKDEFPYIGGSYSRTITADANLSASGAWYNKGTETNVDLPTDAEIEGVTYHPDVKITTSADATLTVNADMNTRNIEFGGSNTLTIAGDETHHLKVYGSVTANSPVIVRYGSADFSTVPVSVGASGSICFDFSAYDFSSVDETTQYVVTGKTSDYGDQITATYPADQNYLYTLAHNAGENKYILTVAPNIAAKQQQAIALIMPYFTRIAPGTGNYTVTLGEDSYTNTTEMNAAIESWTRLSDCVTPVITINQPTSGYYRILNKDTQRYVNCTKVDDEATHTSAGITDDDAAKTIFYIDEDKNIQAYDNGAYWKGVYHMGRGTFNGGTFGWLTYKHPWQFIEGNTLGTYKLIYGNDTEGKYHATGSGEATGHADVDSPAADADAATWTLVPVTELPNRTEAGSAERGNEITYAPAGTTVPATVPNVLVSVVGGKYTCNNLQLTDDVVAQFNTKYVFTTGTTVNYTRASDNQWGTICLPYAVSTDGDVAYYRFVAPVGDQTLRFEKVTDPTTTAKEPYLIKKGAGEGFVVGTTAVEEFSLGDDEVQSTEVHNAYKLQGVMVSTSVIDGETKTEAKEGYQQAVTDRNAYYFDAKDNIFRKLNGRFNLKAFRAYLTKTGTSSADDSSSARSILGIDISEDGQSTGISFVESEDGKTVDVVFDLNGRRLKEAKKGINIINGKKVIK